MMKQFWDERYAAEEYVYGKEANEFFRSKLAGIKPGKALFPAEGEGRNAVYAAKMGWEVSAFDISDFGKSKADQLALENGVNIDYQVGTLGELAYEEESFDLIVLIFAHLPASIRTSFHQGLVNLLKPGGLLILEAYSKTHLTFNFKNPLAGGPKDITMLYSEEDLRTDFHAMSELSLEQEVIFLEEGKYHQGQSAVIRLIGQK